MFTELPNSLSYIALRLLLPVNAAPTSDMCLLQPLGRGPRNQAIHDDAAFAKRKIGQYLDEHAYHMARFAIQQRIAYSPPAISAIRKRFH